MQLKDDNEEEGNLNPIIIKTWDSLHCFTEGAALGNDFTLAGWHVMSDTTKECLEEMILEDKSAVHPLLAYDVFEKIINPKDYCKMLAGASIEMTEDRSRAILSRHLLLT